MILDYETILRKIIDKSGLSKTDVEAKIKEKQIQLQDLISKEGAAHIISNELGIKLFDETPQTLKINNIQVGLNSVNLSGKILNIYETRSFQKNNRSGNIGSLLIGDETGTIRIVIWDENLIKLIKEMKQGDIIKIMNGYSKQNNNGFKELHLGGKSQILINPDGEKIEEVKITQISCRKKIKDLNNPGFAEVFGTVVDIFEPKYYNSCPICSKKLFPELDKFKCQEHGITIPKKTPVLNIYFDDGTGNIRAVLFREQAEKLMNKKENLDELKKEARGKQLLLKGKVTKNEMFNRMELVVNNLEEPDPKEIIAELENQ